MSRLLSIALLILAFVPLKAEAVTSRDILELSRAGLGEEVLLALIEVDGGVFTLDAEMLKSLKQAGVSERVILAMVRSGRERTVDAPAAVPVPTSEPLDLQPQVIAAPPQVIVIEHERPVVQQVAVPVYVPVGPRSNFVRTRRVQQYHQPFDFDPSPGFGAPLPQPFVAPVKREPVYWGWGGKLRPDAWQPGIEDWKHDPRRHRNPDRK